MDKPLFNWEMLLSQILTVISPSERLFRSRVIVNINQSESDYIRVFALSRCHTSLSIVQPNVANSFNLITYEWVGAGNCNWVRYGQAIISHSEAN